MSFIPGSLVNKVVEKGSEFIPIIGPGLKYVKTAKDITKIRNPVKATTYTAGMLVEICTRKTGKYAVLCSVWSTTTIIGLLTGNPPLIAIGLEAGKEILEDFYG